ncbi:MAG: type VI secretion system tip protein TssI/VgrG [Byssovorax sp.]
MAPTISKHPNLTAHIASGDAVDVREFSVHERMNSLFEINLTVVADTANIDFEAAVGQKASFTMGGGVAGTSGRTWTGLCSELHQIGVDDEGLSTYRLTIVPTLWLATQRRNYRMFQQVSELAIALKLLEEWGVEPDKRLTGSYKTRKYRVQYGESDFAFLCRMLEDAGISFFFEPGSEETKMVLSDAPQAADARAPIAFRDEPTKADREHVTAVRIGRRIRPGKYTMRDHDYRKDPTFKLLAEAKDAGGVEEKLERFHYTPGAFLFGTDKGEATPHADDKGKSRTDEGEAQTLAQKRLDAKRGSAKTVHFQTNVNDLAPGVVVSFLDHPRGDLGEDKRFLVIETARHGTHAGEWTTHCEARSAMTAYRPPLVTTKPKVSGVESATVVGAPGEEIHTDEFGRVRVHFHWDRESKMDDNSSCWIHVSQPWGGQGFGGTALPRVGQEVLVDFLGGDPDRPVIVGRVYTNLQKTPYKLPENKTQSGLKSNSTNQTGGYNEIMFEDAAGKELVRLQAEKDWNKLIKHNEDAVVGNNRTRQVKNDESVTVGNNRSKTVQNNEDVVIGQNLTKQVGAIEREITGQNRIISVGVNRSANIGQIDSVVAGSTISTMVSPPGEGGGDGTSQVITNDKIVLSTPGGATLTLEGNTIRLNAETIVFTASHTLSAFGSVNASLGSASGETYVGSGGGEVRVNAAGNKLTLYGSSQASLASGGDVKINGGPMVKINT